MKRHYVSSEQRALLGQEYEKTPHPSYFEWQEIAKKTKLDVQKVKKWFDNHRTHLRKYQYKRLNNIREPETKSSTRMDIVNDKENQAPEGTHILYPVTTYILVKKCAVPPPPCDQHNLSDGTS